MPKLRNRNPKMGKLGNYAVIRYGGKIHYLGKHGTKEALVAYNRFCAELQSNPTGYATPTGEQNVTVSELAAGFLDYAEEKIDVRDYRHCRTAVFDFLLKLYGDGTTVDSFKPSSLKLVREDMIQSQRFCRNTINKYIKWIVSIFTWGVEEELVQETTMRALKIVKSLPKGYPGTFDNPERENVPYEVVLRTLPFMPPTLRAMVVLQWLTGMRPSEVFNMRVGDIDRTRENGLWYYVPDGHKTERYIGKKPIPLGKDAQELLSPFLEGKSPEQAVFSPQQAMEERYAERRANRKTKISPSQAARNAIRAANPKHRRREFYDEHSYGKAVLYAIKKGNKVLPEYQKIPHWFPYQLRHSASTDIELEYGIDASQAMLGHRTANTTKRYSHGQLAKAEKIARNRRNPFDTDGQDKDTA